MEQSKIDVSKNGKMDFDLPCSCDEKKNKIKQKQDARMA